MSGNLRNGRRLGAVLSLCLCGAIAASPAAAQTYVGRSAEQPSDALARSVKILVSSPRDFNALIAAGKASLALGDGQAAAGFFGRAEEVWPNNPQPQVGMGAALVSEGDPSAGLQYFARAIQLGASQTMVGHERGLAYDLLGQHAQAQADYRAALAGTDVDEARRRLALSLAITGKKDEALATLAPLMARGDAAGARCRAFVLALSGDRAGARAAIEAAMPGTAYSMDYFFAKLPSLASPQKAAAVHLGLFPDSAQLAAMGPTSPQQMPSGDRLSSIDQLLSQGAPAAGAAPLTRQQSATRAAPPPPRSVRTAAVARRSVPQAVAAVGESKIWLQLASGDNAAALPQEFERMKSRHDDLFKGIDGYVAQGSDRARLLIGPFRNRQEAGIFAQDLASVRISAFPWTSPAGQSVRKITGE